VERSSQAEGSFTTLCGLTGFLGICADSTPERRRRRYGDVQYDWITGQHDERHRGLAKSAAGVFHSPYQPTDPSLFHEMLGALKIDFRGFTFIDLGSGKGRVLLIAADYPFRRIVGVELLTELHAWRWRTCVNTKVIRKSVFDVETICGDARTFTFPAEPTVLYLFNPLTEEGLSQVIVNLERSLRDQRVPCTCFITIHCSSTCWRTVIQKA